MNNMEEFLKLVVKSFEVNPQNNETTLTQERYVYSLLNKFQLVGFDWDNKTELNNFAKEITNSVETNLQNTYESKSFENGWFNYSGSKMTRKNTFLWFQTGEVNGNEVKLYIPLPLDQYEQGSSELFQFLAKENITHQSKISEIYRNDNVVVRVTNLEDAMKVIDFVNSTPSLQRTQQPNPFIPNINGVGITMDNKYSYNSEVSDLIAQAYRTYGKDLNLENFRILLDNELENNIGNPDLKDIYTILRMQLDPNMDMNNLLNFMDDKLINKYDLSPGPNFRERITDPKFYLEQALKETYNKMHNVESLKVFLKTKNINGITRDNRARDGYQKYVKDEDVLNIMCTEISKYGLDPTTMTEDAIIETYLDSVLKLKPIQRKLDKTAELPEVTCYNIIEQAIKETQLVHPKDNNCLNFLKQLLTGADIDYKAITRNNGARQSVLDMFEKYPNVDFVPVAVNLLREVYGIEENQKTM